MNMQKSRKMFGNVALIDNNPLKRVYAGTLIVQSVGQHYRGRTQRINKQRNTDTAVLLHMINLIDLHVRHPLGRLLLALMASWWLRPSASVSRCCFHAVKIKHCCGEVTFIRRPLSRSKQIKLIYN